MNASVELDTVVTVPVFVILPDTFNIPVDVKVIVPPLETDLAFVLVEITGMRPDTTDDGIITSSIVVGIFAGNQLVFVAQAVLVVPVQVRVQFVTITEYDAVAFAHGLLLTVMVSVTVLPASAARGV